jgi:hypothetical protein
MQKRYVFFGIIIVFISIINLSAQQIFIDSRQGLGNSISWDVKMSDLDGDNDLDAVVANWNFVNPSIIQNNEIWLNDGYGVFEKSSQELGSCQGITLFDIDSDGDTDIIENAEILEYLTQIKVWVNDGKGIFSFSDKYLFEGNSIAFDNKISSVNQVCGVTIESSGDSTILRLYSANSDTSIIEKMLVYKKFIGIGITIGDLNNDGYSDIVLCQDGPNYLLLNDKNGSFVLSEERLLGTYNTQSVVLGDLNGDGYLDILQVNYHNPENGTIYPVKLYLNEKTGKFTSSPLSYNSSYLTSSAIIADFDNDGDSDIYLNHGNQFAANTHKSEILFNDGSANFTSNKIELGNVQSISLACGDLDKDGYLDLFLACGSTDVSENQDRVWLNTSSVINSIHTKDIISLSVFPNPTNGHITLSLGTSQNQKALVEIYNLQGAQVFSKTFQNSSSATIDLTGNSAGIYVVKVIADGACYEEKIVKE